MLFGVLFFCFLLGLLFFEVSSAEEASSAPLSSCNMNVSPEEVAQMNGLLAESLELPIWQESLKVSRQVKQFLATMPGTQRKRDAVVFDLDETLLDNRGYFARYARFEKPCWDAWALTGQAGRLPLSYELYQWVIKKGYTVFFISGRSEALRQATEKNLSQLGYSRYQHLYLKPLEMQAIPTGVYKAKTRQKIQADGFIIHANVGDQQSDFEGGYYHRAFKLPNKLYTVK